MNTYVRAVTIVMVMVFLKACSSDSVPLPVPTPPLPQPEPIYQAKLTRTDYNVVHIEAGSFGDIGFGQGYATAQDSICVLADQFVKIKSERAKYFGVGPGNVFLASDIGYKAIGHVQTAEESFDSLSDTTKELITGYAAGYNQYLEDTAPDLLPAACANVDWVEPITPQLLLAYYLDVAASLTSSQFIPLIAAATPPTVSAQKQVISGDSLEVPNTTGASFGSNMLTLGAEKTEHGKGMLLANPHLPWFGQFTYTEQHLMIPDELNVYGVQILGFPMLGIGFSEYAAQTVTVSFTSQYTAYQLSFSGSPTTYLYDGEERELTSKEFQIEVLQEDGTVVLISHTSYASHYGPMLILPGVGEWTETSGVTARFPDYLPIIDSYIQTMLQKDNEEFKSLLSDVGGSPFLNYTRANSDGKVFYVDAAPVPNLSAEALQGFFVGLQTNPIANALLSNGIVLLDGSNSLFEWVDDPLATSSGLIPFAFAPQYEGNDYAVHTNENPWIVNADSPINLPSPFYGQQGAPRQHRNRTGFALIKSSAGGDNLFNFDELKSLQFNNKSNLVDLIKDDLATHCLVDPTFELNGEAVDLSTGCNLLANWDGKYNAKSVGAPIFREFISNYSEAQLSSGVGFFAVPFDPLMPLTTPNTLLIQDGPRAEDPLLMNLASAIKTLQTIDIPLDAPFSDWQFTNRSGERVSIPGASGSPEGAWNVVGYDTGALNSSLIHRPQAAEFVKANTALTADGYVVNLGPSFIMAVSYEDEEPKAEAVLVYGQSRDRKSVHHDDQMPLLSAGELRPVYFTSSDVIANAVSELEIEAF